MNKQGHLSKSAKKRHIESGGDSECPFCKDEDSTNLEYQDFEPMAGGLIEQKAQCLKCGRSWIDLYKLSIVYSVDPVTGTRY